MEEQEIKKVLKNNKASLIVALILLVVTIGVFGYAFYIQYQTEKDPLNLSELIANGEEKEGQYVYLDIAYVPYSFAEEEGLENNYYYFAMDKDAYMYVVRMTNATYDQIYALYDENKETIEYRLQGYTVNIDSSLKNLAIEAANEALEGNTLNASNFSDYMGTVYIDQTSTFRDETQSTLMGIGIMLGVFTIVVGIVGITQVVSGSKVVKNEELMEELRNELETIPDNQYKKLKVYLTNKYVIFKAGGLTALEYRDIIWVYPQITYRNGVAVSKTLIICTNQKKKYSATSTGANNAQIDEIMTEINDKNSEVRIGYTKENRQFFKNYHK